MQSITGSKDLILSKPVVVLWCTLEGNVVLGIAKGLRFLELSMQLDIQSCLLHNLVLGHQIAPLKL